MRGLMRSRERGRSFGDRLWGGKTPSLRLATQNAPARRTDPADLHRRGPPLAVPTAPLWLRGTSLPLRPGRLSREPKEALINRPVLRSGRSPGRITVIDANRNRPKQLKPYQHQKFLHAASRGSLISRQTRFRLQQCCTSKLGKVRNRPSGLSAGGHPQDRAIACMASCWAS